MRIDDEPQSTHLEERRPNGQGLVALLAEDGLHVRCEPLP